MLSNSERNPNGTFKRKFFVPWDGSKWDEGFLHRTCYFYVYRPDHPSASPMGMVRRHHVVWWLATGHVIQPGEALHHRNEVKTDDWFENLELMSHGEHTRIHFTKPMVPCTCVVCGDTFHLPQWRINEGRGSYCSQPCFHQRPITVETRQKQAKGMKLAYIEGRMNPVLPKGENHPMSKLTNQQAREIRNSSMGCCRLARQYGVSKTVIKLIRRGITYAA
jgi:hypothetical protein